MLDVARISDSADLPARGQKAPPSKPRFNSAEFLDGAGSGTSIVTLKGHDVCFAQGEPAIDLFYIRKGTIRLTVVSKQGKEAVIGVLAAGAFFGEGCLVGQALRIATATATTACSLTRLEKVAVVELLHKKPDFSNVLLAHVFARNIRVEGDLVDQLFNSSEKRLARALLLMANFGTEGNPETEIPKVSQEVLAEMIGTTRSRVNFFMNKFRRLGYIQYNGVIKVHNSLLTVVLRD